MVQIKVNTEVLENKIQSLRALKQTCEGIDVTEKELVGSGVSIGLLNEVDREYTELRAVIAELIGSSVAFFTNVKGSVQTADSKASDELKNIETAMK